MSPNPNGPLSKLRLLDTQAFSGSVQERSDRWRFLGMLFGWRVECAKKLRVGHILTKK